MAHYAEECWDGEIECSYGWIEVCGHSDRSCFDLSRHAAKTKVELVAARQLKNPIKMQMVRAEVDKKKVGKDFKKDSKPINDFIDNLDKDQLDAFATEMDKNKSVVLKMPSKEIKLSQECIKFIREEKIVMEEKYTPSVIEPSYGLGRIMYCIFEHCFQMREEDQQRTYFDFPISVAPVKCSILPLINKDALN